MFDDNNRLCGLATLVIYMQTRPAVYESGSAANGHKFKKGGFVSMSRKISFAALVTGTVLLCLPAFSQDEGSRSDVSAQFFGTFVKNTNQNGVRQSSSDSGGVLASYRFFFSKHHGVEANYGYSRSTTSYDFLLGSSGVTANQHEWSGAYVFRVPMRRITPFIEANVGGLTFSPRKLRRRFEPNPCGFRLWWRGGLQFDSSILRPSPVPGSCLQYSDAKCSREPRHRSSHPSSRAFRRLWLPVLIWPPFSRAVPPLPSGVF